MIVWPAVKRLLLTVLTSLLVVTSSLAINPAQLANGLPSASNTLTPTNSATNNSRLWNLQNADLLSVIDAVSHETGKNFIVDPRVQGKVTLVSSQPMSADEIYQVFLAVLQTHGYAAVTYGKFIRIVPDIEARQNILRLADGNQSIHGSQMVVQVVPVKNVPVEQLVRMLRPLLPQSADISAYSPSNTLIISANADKVDDMLALIKRVDSTNATGIEIVPLKNATAADLVTTINALQQNNNRFGGPGTTVSLAADERSNSILLNGDLDGRSRLHDLITQLDKPNPNSTGNTSVIYLRYLNAKDFAPILRGIATGTPVDDTGTTNNSNTDNSNPANAPINSLFLRAMPASTNTSNNASSPTNTTELGGGKVQVQAEPNTNSLIITAPPAIMLSLKEVIKQLDVRPAQVLVEAIIVEISEKRLQQLGIEWGTRSLPGTAPAGDNFSNLTGGLGIGFINSGNIRALVSALATDTSSNILATPSLVVLDNQKADIKVGKQVPTQTGSLANTASSGSVLNTTDYKDVVLELQVTPQINLGDAIRLAIQQGNDTVADQTGVASNPVFNTAQIKTQVMVNNGQILVLGGLINNDFEQARSRVPILSSIPGIGALFTSKNHTLDKKNLVVFLRPLILRDSVVSDTVTNQKYDFTRSEQLQRQREAGALTPADANPLLTPRRKPVQLPAPFSNN